MSIARIVVVSLFVLGTVFPSLVQAEKIIAKGEASMVIDSRKPSAKDQQQVMLKAKVNAIESYLSRQGQSQMGFYDKRARYLVEERVDDFLLAVHPLKEDFDKSSRRLRTVIRVQINTSRLLDTLRQFSSTSRKPRFDKSKITFVFISRQQGTVISSRANVDATGTVVHRAEQTRFKVPNVDTDVENTVKRVFVEKGFRVVSTTRLESRAGGAYKKRRLEEQYVRTGKINWESAERAAEVINCDLFAFGTFDIGIYQRDKVSDLIRVTVRANAELIDLEESETIAVIGNITYSAEGNTEAEAINTARALAAEKVAQQLTAQLNIQDIY